ncbi:MAG TPA: hypothetical protein VNK04_20555 [Gemmataceae bacterium]|nr:hypothetical protein [Gemmataceae bacterium]
MSHNDRPAALPEEQVREIINRWNDQGYFRIKYLGDKIFIDEIIPHYSYTLRLQTEYEERSVRPVTVPFSGGAVDDQGRPPDPWDIPVRRPDDFENRTEMLAVPHTERVGPCSHCAGQGRVDCLSCYGSGRVNCPWCHGTGYRERREMRTERDIHGNLSTQTVTIRDSCTCAGGKVTCSSCSGNGRIVCPGCDGSGCVKTFDQLTVCFRCDTLSAVLDETGVPDQLVGELSGEVVVDERGPRVDRVSPVTPEVDRQVRTLLQKSHAVDEAQSRILLQQLRVERVGIQEVRYRYAGVERQLWICGNEQYVHAPGVPWQWKRLAAILAGAAAAVIAVIVVVLLLLFG